MTTIETILLKSEEINCGKNKYLLIERWGKSIIKRNINGEVISDFSKKRYITIRNGKYNKNQKKIIYKKHGLELPDSVVIPNNVIIHLAKRIVEF